MNPEITTVILQFIAMLILLIANGFFVSVELAYVTVPRPRIDQLAEGEYSRHARTVLAGRH